MRNMVDKELGMSYIEDVFTDKTFLVRRLYVNGLLCTFF